MSSLRKPRPTPQFFSEPQTFSTKKARGTPRNQLPPPLPYKSAPPAVSRIFKRPETHRAQAVSFRDSDCSISSPHYDESRHELYFDQCFEIECKLGTGSFGEVFKVRSLEDGKYYAVKKSRQRFRGATDRKRKLEEVQKHEELPKHPNCIQFLKAWEEQRYLYILTELCECSLSDFCEVNHDIPETLVWNYLVDLLQAVNHLHSHDLIHLDIKPDNIFISYDGLCKLGDFGLVLNLRKGDLSEAQEGDPKYLAPELMTGTFTKAADIFSLGITMLEVASDLNLPRGDEGWHQLRSGYIPHEFTKHLSPELKHIIQAMMNPDHKTRPTAEHLLSIPKIVQVVKKRKWYSLFQVLVKNVKSKCFGFYLFLMNIWSFVTRPLYKAIMGSKMVVTPPHPSTSTGKRIISDRHPLDWDLSSYDDDVFDYDDSLGSQNNSFNSPVYDDMSTSSESHDSNIYPRLVNSTPVLKKPQLHHRNISAMMTSDPSPLSHSKIDHEPVDHPSYQNSTNTSRNGSRLKRNLLDDLMNAGDQQTTRSEINPKNLMSVFDCSDDDGDIIR